MSERVRMVEWRRCGETERYVVVEGGLLELGMLAEFLKEGKLRAVRRYLLAKQNGK